MYAESKYVVTGHIVFKTDQTFQYISREALLDEVIYFSFFTLRVNALPPEIDLKQPEAGERGFVKSFIFALYNCGVINTAVHLQLTMPRPPKCRRLKITR